MQTQLHYRLIEEGRVTLGHLSDHGPNRRLVLPQRGAVVSFHENGLDGQYLVRAILGPFSRGSRSSYMLELIPANSDYGSDFSDSLY